MCIVLIQFLLSVSHVDMEGTKLIFVEKSECYEINNVV